MEAPRQDEHEDEWCPNPKRKWQRKCQEHNFHGAHSLEVEAHGATVGEIKPL